MNDERQAESGTRVNWGKRRRCRDGEGNVNFGIRGVREKRDQGRYGYSKNVRTGGRS